MATHARGLFAPALLALGALLAAPASAAAQTRTLDSADYRLDVTPVVTGLELPWSLAFLPDGQWLVTERPGRMRVVREGRLLAEPVEGLPELFAEGQGGLLDVTPHPDYAHNRLVYWSYTAPGPGGAGTEVARGRLACEQERCRMEAVEVLFRQQPKTSAKHHFGSRLVWDREGRLFVTLGDRGDQDRAQELGHHLGKVLRLTDTGGVPPDNPFADGKAARPEVWSWGHRSVQGAALNPDTGELWTHEHGPQGGDEVNVEKPGRNYGWPRITYGKTYGLGLAIGEGTEAPDVEPPRKVWIPSIAPSGMAFYTGERFPAWRGSLFVGAMAAQCLVRLTLDGGRVVGEERIEGLGRVRDVRQGPDGLLYVLTESEGALLRIVPANP